MSIEDDALRELYELEKPILQRNDWSSLRVAVNDLAHQFLTAFPTTSDAEFLAAVSGLRLRGKIMLFPPWEELDKSSPLGTIHDSLAQWELADVANLEDQVPPSWNRREVFLPHSLERWFLRSRTAELTRLLGFNRERFGLAPSSAHVGYELQARFRPKRIPGGIHHAVRLLAARAQQGNFYRAADSVALAQAIEIVGNGFQRSTGSDLLAPFQTRAWESVLESVFDPASKHLATMASAGVSSGKTYSFALPILTLVTYRRLVNQGGINRALVIYPRTSLVEDQYHTFSELIAGVNEELIARGLPTITAKPALDAGQMLGTSIGLTGPMSLSDVLPEVARRKTEIILTTSESLKNRMIDCRALHTYFGGVEIVVFDEIHLMEGLSGCQSIFLVRRLRQLVRTLRADAQFEPAWMGASATVAEPVEHCARALSLPVGSVRHVTPENAELERFATFHHVFVHTRQGRPAISAVTNGLSCATHNRNDSTAHSHYVDPSATPSTHRPGAEIPKTITFVDSLSTIGRLRFTTADNEKTYDPFGSSGVPYYSWFYRPAARLRATAAEVASIERLAGRGSMGDLRKWCAKCFRGEPAFIGKAVLQAPEFRFLRTASQMDRKAIEKATPPGLPERLAQLPDRVGNLDQCPFLTDGVCWWSSQDPGARLAVGPGRVFVDQNRAIPYTSKTQDADKAILHADVNDYFVIPSEELWERARGVRGQTVSTSTLIASPRIEVGVDFQNVRDGVTHKALRSASSFQQKIGRVGREDGSDSVIVTFLAQRATDAHFAHHPARLINAQHLDPIPLKADNPDVIKSALFTAALDFVASRAPGTIPNRGERLNIIGTGGTSEPSWEAKVTAVSDFLTAHRTQACEYMRAAVGNIPSADPNGALDAALSMLDGLTVNLQGAFHTPGSAAHWIYSNTVPATVPAFGALLQQAGELRSDAIRFSVYAPVAAAIQVLLEELAKPSPSAQALQAGATDLQQKINAVSPPDPSLFAVIGKAWTLAGTFGTINTTAGFSRMRFGFEVVRSFEQSGAADSRRMSLFYLHNLLTTLIPFRTFYPFGMPRTMFQHVNAKDVTVTFSDGTRAVESLAASLFELLPGSWNYRWVLPRKSACGRVEQLGGSDASYANLNNIEAIGAIFEPTTATLSASDLPSEMPQFGPSDVLPVYRPRSLPMLISHFRPTVDRMTSLVADDDEAPRTNDPSAPECPTLPRAFPVSWYRISGCTQQIAVRSPEDPSVGVGIHEYPAVGRCLFEDVSFSTDMKTDTFVYAIDRTYGIAAIESPRIYYRKGHPHQWAAIGDQATQTDGLIFRLNAVTIHGVILQATAAGPLRGELLIRTLRRFFFRETGADPFEADMLRKLVLSQLLDSGKTLCTINIGDIQQAISAIDQERFNALRDVLIDGLVAGTSGNERSQLRQRYADWYDAAYSRIGRAQAASARFDLAFLHNTANDILIHSLAVLLQNAIASLIGASDGDFGYFYNRAKLEIYLFDTVEGGNGYAETARRFLHIPPLQRILYSRGKKAHLLPDVDGFQFLEEAMGDCPGQLTTRIVFDAIRHGVADFAVLSFHPSVSADSQARVKHEFNGISGSSSVLDALSANWPTMFHSWQDLLWVQVLPERFAATLTSAGVVSGIEDLRTRTHLCVAGCIECVDNGDGSVHGALASAEHVSRGLIDLVRQYVIQNEQASYLRIPAGQSIGEALQQSVAQPVLDATGRPVTVLVDDGGTPRQVLLTKVLSTVSNAHGISPGGSVLRPLGHGRFEVVVPFVASYRDERPLP
jgi:DEAD/DEAH box helicase